MEPLNETPWDVVISGTGVQQSLLALALSRSGKKILHLDHNDYYGGSEAAFSLQEAEEWIERLKSHSQPQFSKASSRRAETAQDAKSAEKLSFPRAYTLTLSPQIIYSKSKLLSQLVSSKVYRQLEFQAVGNWWLYERQHGSTETTSNSGTLKRLPNGREDIFSDREIDVRAKRSLMKFLKFVVDYEEQAEVWQPHANMSLPEFLSSKFQLPSLFQTLLVSLTLSLNTPSATTVGYAIPRISRHLTSIGVFGPGFGSILPKWGGGSEIAQVACRAGAVGGAVYMLGHGVSKSQNGDSALQVTLTSGEQVSTQLLVQSEEHGPTTKDEATTDQIARTITIVSSELAGLFAATVEAAPSAAVSVVVFPSNSLEVEGVIQAQPVYVMVHSSDTGGCPIGQSVLYATTLVDGGAKALLESAVATVLSTLPSSEIDILESEQVNTSPKILFEMYYEQTQTSKEVSSYERTHSFPPSSLDLAFDDTTLDNVERVWQAVTGNEESASGAHPYMIFDDREGMENDDNDGE